MSTMFATISEIQKRLVEAYIVHHWVRFHPAQIQAAMPAEYRNLVVDALQRLAGIEFVESYIELKCEDGHLIDRVPVETFKKYPNLYHCKCGLLPDMDNSLLYYKAGPGLFEAADEKKNQQAHPIAVV